MRDARSALTATHSPLRFIAIASLLLTMLHFTAAFTSPAAFRLAARTTLRPMRRTLAPAVRRLASVMPAAAPETRSREQHQRLLQTLQRAPRTAGVYVMKSAQGDILYIGKSVDIKTRMDAYFNKDLKLALVTTAAGVSDRIAYMTELVADIEYTATPTAADALLLEAALIRAHQPPFNVLLKDDKRYPYVCVSWSKTYPEVFIARRKNDESIARGDRYFGPFPDTAQLQQLMRMLKQTFRLKQRPEALYSGRSSVISPEEYREQVRLAQMVLEGRVDALLSTLRAKEGQRAQLEDFEQAIRFRDMGREVEQVLHGASLHFHSSGQVAVTTTPAANASVAGFPTIDESPVDVIGVNATADTVVVTITKVRKSRITLRLGFTCERSKFGDADVHKDDAAASASMPDDVLEAVQLVLEQHYAGLGAPEEYPAAVILPAGARLPSLELLQDLFAKQSASPVAIGPAGSLESEHLVSFATQLAHQASATRQLEMRSVEDSLLQLSEMLQLATLPTRIEAFDISHIQGTNTVASCVVFEEGEPVVEQYRTFRIPQSDQPGAPNDYFSIQEAIRRRFKSRGGASHGSKRSSSASSSSVPDVLLIDGGKGQLSAAISALQEEGVELPCVIALAKDKEEVFVPGCSEPVNARYDVDSPAMRLLRRARDEAHRHALSRHRISRSIQMFKSKP